MPPEDDDDAQVDQPDAERLPVDLEAAFRRHCRSRRLKLGMSQEEVAVKMRERGHSYWQGTVAKLEGRPGRAVRLNEAAALADVLDFWLSEFIAVWHEGPPERAEAMANVEELIAEQKELLREARRTESSATALQAEAAEYARRAREARDAAVELDKRALNVAQRVQAAVERASRHADDQT